MDIPTKYKTSNDEDIIYKNPTKSKKQNILNEIVEEFINDYCRENHVSPETYSGLFIVACNYAKRLLLNQSLNQIKRISNNEYTIYEDDSEIEKQKKYMGLITTDICKAYLSVHKQFS